jgi:hypothetical protein
MADVLTDGCGYIHVTKMDWIKRVPMATSLRYQATMSKRMIDEGNKMVQYGVAQRIATTQSELSSKLCLFSFAGGQLEANAQLDR